MKCTCHQILLSEHTKRMQLSCTCSRIICTEMLCHRLPQHPVYTASQTYKKRVLASSTLHHEKGLISDGFMGQTVAFGGRHLKVTDPCNEAHKPGAAMQCRAHELSGLPGTHPLKAHAGQPDIQGMAS